MNSITCALGGGVTVLISEPGYEFLGWVMEKWSYEGEKVGY